MYNSGGVLRQSESRIPTEQAVFDTLSDYVIKQAQLGRIQHKAYTHFSQQQWYNVTTTDAVASILDLMAARMSRQHLDPSTVLHECVRVVYAIVSSLIAKQDPAFFNQLSYDERQQIDIDLQMANVVDSEITLWQTRQNNPTVTPQGNGGVRSSVYTRMSSGQTHRGPVPTTMPVETAPARTADYRPARPGSTVAQQAPAVAAAPAPTATYLGSRGGSARVAAPEVKTAPIEQPDSPQSQEPKVNSKRLVYVFNPKTHDDKGNEMDYDKHKPSAALFPQLSTSTPPQVNALQIAAGGLVFDPLSIETPADPEQPVAVPDMSDRLVHYGAQVLASGPRHAELMIRAKLLEEGITLNDQVLGFEYRDFSPIQIYPSKEDAGIAFAGSALQELNQVLNITGVHDIIGKLKAGSKVDQQVANIINKRATEFMNDFMAFALGKSDWSTTDFYDDWSAIISTMQEVFADDLEWLQNLLTDYTPAFIARTTGSVFIDFDTETADVINKLAGLKSPTLRQRTVMLSDLHAVLDLPLQSHELGLEATQFPALLTPLRGCELLYDAVSNFFGRLNADPSAYRTITILTSDEQLIRVRPTDLAVAPDDDRRSIAVTSVRCD